MESLNPRRELIGAFVVGDGHHRDFRFWKAIAACLGVLVGEFEVAEFFDRRGESSAVEGNECEKGKFHVAWAGE